jgi:hypothetical protein
MDYKMTMRFRYIQFQLSLANLDEKNVFKV